MKDKKRTAAHRPHAGRKSIRDVIVMLNNVTMSHICPDLGPNVFHLN